MAQLPTPQPLSPDTPPQWAGLMACACDTEEPAALALAGTIARAWEQHGPQLLPLAGLSANDTRRLLERWFPGADRLFDLNWSLLGQAVRHEPRFDEIEDLVGLLREYGCERSVASAEELNWLAHALANASLGDNHLWQDMGLPSRRVLTDLMARYFPVLAARNDRDMKWKKFLYKQLCERAELFICKAPSCSVCVDQPICFGPEDASPSPAAAVA